MLPLYYLDMLSHVAEGRNHAATLSNAHTCVSFCGAGPDTQDSQQCVADHSLLYAVVKLLIPDKQFCHQ